MSGRHPAGPRGFSLVELLLTMAIVGVMAAVALPSYASYVSRARRVAGRSSLVQVAHWLERAATSSGRYPDAVDIPPGLLRTDGDHYRLIAVTTAITFQLEAVPQGPHAGDRCGTLTLLHSGERKTSNATSDPTVDACWNR